MRFNPCGTSRRAPIGNFLESCKRVLIVQKRREDFDDIGSHRQWHMALPEFQRGYVWNRDQVRGLFDSVPSIYSSVSPWVGSQPCGAKYPGFCADSKGV